MNIKEFVKRALAQDPRNVFEKTNIDITFIPKTLKDFYRYANPIDVEIYVEGNPIHFFGVDVLNKIQDEYSLGNERFVFANSNGDPIYLYEERVYTRYHGSGIIEDELISDRFEEFLDLLGKVEK